MKIRVIILLVSNAVFLHFGELNAMNLTAGPSFRFREVGPMDRGKTNGGVMTVVVDADDGPDYKTVIYGMKPILVWLDVTQSYVRKAYFPNCRIPLGPYFNHNNFLIRYANLQGTGLVAYLDQQGELMGVKPPNMTAWRTLKPTPTEWFIIYYRTKFKLAVNPITKTVYGISLLPRNVHDAQTHLYVRVTVANIKFKVFRGRNLRVSGAELVEPYIYKVG